MSGSPLPLCRILLNQKIRPSNKMNATKMKIDMVDESIMATRDSACYISRLIISSRRVNAYPMNHLHTEGFQNLTRVDDALKRLFDALGEPAVQLESVDLWRALGRYLGKDVVAHQYLPPVDRAVMDGYAVRAEDVKNATQENPVILEVAGESRLGVACRIQVGPRRAVAVATGSMIPAGADTVVIVERTATLRGNRIAVRAPATVGQSIARKGEDVSPGTVVLKKGMRLRPQDIGMLKALGLARIDVARRPRVAILSTGNELADSLSKRGTARIIDVNRPIISAMLQELGAEPVDLGIVKDREAEITTALRKGLKSSDVVLISAGSSVGKRDLIPKCVNRLGKPGMLVHGVAMRPAMPTGLAVVRGKPVLSLPGFPVSALFAFRVFARPLIAKMIGARKLVEPAVKAVLKRRITGAPGQRTFVRVTVRMDERGLVAEPLKLQRSSVLMSMVGANGIVTIPEDATAFEAGQTVDVTLVGEISP
jgi:molybdopterin molybdotransferase